MKVTIEKRISEEIEVSPYFEINGRCYKLLSDGYCMSVNVQELDTVLDLAPNISIKNVQHYVSSGFNPISKESFDLAYLKAEKILNELRK